MMMIAETIGCKTRKIEQKKNSFLKKFQIYLNSEDNIS